MDKTEARKFAYDSFVRAFEASNEALLDNFFANNLDCVCFNNASTKVFNLPLLKSKLTRIQARFQGLTSEIQDVISDGDHLAFNVVQTAQLMPEDKPVRMNVMNTYRLADGKVQEWRIWFNQEDVA